MSEAFSHQDWTPVVVKKRSSSASSSSASSSSKPPVHPSSSSIASRVLDQSELPVVKTVSHQMAQEFIKVRTGNKMSRKDLAMRLNVAESFIVEAETVGKVYRPMVYDKVSNMFSTKIARE
jgi:DNA-binding transcriptional regulator YiaG